MSEQRTFDQAIVGETFDPVTITVSEEHLRRFAAIPGVAEPWWLTRALAGEPIVPPGVVEGSGMVGLTGRFRMGSGVMTNLTYQHFRPVRLGDRLVAQASIIDMFERRGRNYLVLETRVTTESGEPVVTTEQTFFQRPEEFAEKTA